MTKCHHPSWAPTPPALAVGAQSHTLPINSNHYHNHQLSDVCCCCPNRSRITGNQHRTLLESSQSCCGQSGGLMASGRVLSLIGLSLVFILIWSSILSSILIIRSVREQESAQIMLEHFDIHKHFGQLTFAFGQQMLRDLQELPSLSSTEDSEPEPEELAIQQISESFQGFEERLESIRSKCRNISFDDQSTMVECVKIFTETFGTISDEIVQQEQNQQLQRHSRGMATDLALRNMPYALFVRGMIHRFTALGLGLTLVRSNIQNSKLLNVSEYFEHFYCSRRQIESSFLWNVRAQQKYLELEQSEYQTEMLVHLINERLAQQQEIHADMSVIFGRLFTEENLDRINTYIKKRKAESIERLMVMNGTKTLYVADEDANNQISIPLDAQFLESFGLSKIEKIVKRMDNVGLPRKNVTQQYETVVRNQVRFLVRVQDFLNVSIYAHLAQSVTNEQTNLAYHLIAVVILVASVLFCLLLFLCSWFCSRCHHAYQCGLLAGNRRLRRRGLFWPLISPFKRSNSISKLSNTGCCCHHRKLFVHQSPIKSKNCQTNVVFPCSSPNAFLVSSSSKRTFAGGVINRYSATPIAGTGTTTKTALLTYKFENSRSSGKTGRCHCGGAGEQSTNETEDVSSSSPPPPSSTENTRYHHHHHHTSPKNKSVARTTTTAAPEEAGKDSS